MKNVISMSSVIGTCVVALSLTACGAKTEEDANPLWAAEAAAGQAEAQKILNMTPAEEMKEAAVWDAAFKNPAQKAEVGMTITLLNDPAIQTYVNGIGQHLAAKAPRQDITYKFQVVKNDEINAFATIGGFVYINSGLIKTADTEAELAGVIAHEIIHNSSKHALKAAADSAIINGLAKGAGFAGIFVQIIGQVTGKAPRSRSFEREADNGGFMMLRNSGYAAAEMKQFFVKLFKLYGDSEGPFSTHPATSSRIQALEAIERPSDRTGYGTDKASYAAVKARL